MIANKSNIANASCLEDLKSPPGNKLHPLKGDRKGQWAISVNGPWRLCFYFDKQGATEIELVQYHLNEIINDTRGITIDTAILLT